MIMLLYINTNNKRYSFILYENITAENYLYFC